MKIKVKAPAKTNLTLEVIKRLPDGYHELRTLIIRSDKLFDEITIDIKKGSKISVRSDSREVPTGEKNTCFRIIKKYLEKISAKAEVDIHIKKRIPLGGGFGGGSTDGASVLLALNKYFKNKLNFKQLIEIADEVGKDIPVFLPSERAVLVGGMGEKLTPIKNLPKMPILVVNPGVHSSTKEAFKMLSKELWFMEDKKRVNISLKMKKAIEKNDTKGIVSGLYNDFELVLEKTFPIIKELKQTMRAFGAEGSLMSGAGSSVFGIFSSLTVLESAEREMKKKYPKFFIERF